MTTITKMRGIIAAIAIILAGVAQVSAIEGLQISVQCSNVVLYWPSQSGESYIVQYRPDLVPTTQWITLTNYMPPDDGTNITIFVHTNVVQHPNCGSGSSSSAAMFSGEASEPIWASEPLAMRTDGSGGVVPVTIFPPGFEFSNYLLYNPSTDEWESGAGIVRAWPSSSGSLAGVNSSSFGPEGDGPTPEDDGPTTPPETGFYQVVRDGVHIVNLTNFTAGPVSNTIPITFEAGNPDGIIQDASILVDGTWCRGAQGFEGWPVYPPTLSVDTCFLENGDHTFQVVVGWLNPNFVEDANNWEFHRYSDPFTVTVSNVIYYPDWEDEVGELGFSAYYFKTTCTNADWQIDIYDVGSNYVQTLSGNTGDGTIEAYWNMVDTNNVARTNADIDPEFTAMITVADPQRKQPPKKKAPPAYPVHAQWVIAYQDIFRNVANSNNYYNAIYDFGGIAANYGGAITLFPSDPTNAQTFPLRWPWTNPVVNVPIQTLTKDAQGLLSLLAETNSRNFYYSGHSNPRGLPYLSSDKIQFSLQKRYYRFVFIDGCQSANGPIAAAFGNNANRDLPLSYYQTRGTRPRAFLGYDRDVKYLEGGTFVENGVTYNRRVPDCVHYFLSNFEFYWYFIDHDLDAALSDAYINNVPPTSPGSWDNGANLKLFGYGGLGMDDYNSRSQWQN